MKRIGNLKKEWCTIEALMQAWKEVRKNKTYHSKILEYESNLIPNLNRILEQLESDTYQVKPTRNFYITDPKERLIEAPHLEDRIVQHAILNSIRDTIEKRFIRQTYACIRERGTHNASDLLKKYLISYKNGGYYLKLDIRKFFYSVDQNSLEIELRKILKCEKTINILRKFYINDGGKGLPLGNVTSQILANLALNPLDHYIKRVLKIRHYIRYMDDLILLSLNKLELKNALEKIKNLLSGLKLELNGKTFLGLIAKGIDFVGYKTWFNSRLIRKRSLYKIKRTLKKEPNMQRISSYLSHAKMTNSLLYVVKQILTAAPSFWEFIKKWMLNNKIEVYNVLLTH
jgi:retron-type reverse transcriptase